MRQRRCFLVSVLSLWLLAASVASFAALPPADSQGRELPTLAPMLEGATPAVVNIATFSRVRVRDNPLLMDPFFRRFFGIPDQPRERQKQSLGSGVVVDAQRGFILTNHHVIDKADEITVTLRDGRSLQAELVGSDPEADVAVIKIAAENLTAIPLADSDTLRVGDFVVAIGNPFGLGQTVTSGIVSALGRSGLGIEGYEDFIQTDASINPGNSGGALVNLRGELVGVNTAILAPNGGNVGIGFAIPVNMAAHIMKELVEYGEVRRGYLGIAVQELTPELANAFGLTAARGAVISRIVKGSVAEEAGLRVGDIVDTIGGRAVKDAADVRNAIGLAKIGETLTLGLRRDGRQLHVNVTLREPQVSLLNGEEIDGRLAGALFQDIDESSPLYGHINGVIINNVQRGSPAWGAGLRPGDVIVSLNRQPLASVAQFQQLAENAPSLLLHLRRGDGALFLLLQ